MALRPINGYILIEPVAHESFMASEKTTYDEIGVVVAVPTPYASSASIKPGMKVYFDSFMAKKYPNPDKADAYYWLVHTDEICAVND